MKNIYKFGLIGLGLLGGCATSTTPGHSSATTAPTKPTLPITAIAPVHSGAIAKRLNDCIIKSNQSADALLVDSQIIAVTRNNPHAKALLNSSDKLTDTQVIALKNYLMEANACRSIALEGVSPKMNSIYEEFFTKIDGVYADLMAKKITIGVANQERQLLIQDVYIKRKEMMSQGGK